VTRVAAGVLLAASVALPGWIQPQAARAEGPRQALILTLSGVSFEEAMRVPELRQLARAGGAGLMTTYTGGPATVPAAYATVWAGAVSRPLDVPSLLFLELRANGIPVCQNTTNAELVESVGRVRQLSGPTRSPSCLHDWTPGLRGGAGFVDVEVGVRRCLDVVPCVIPPGHAADALRTDLAALGESIRRVIGTLPDLPTLLMIVVPAPSPSMASVGDEVTPLVFAEGMPGRFLPPLGPLRGLRSDTTRQDGLVANVDVAPTILRFFGIDLPSRMDGEPVRTIEGGPAFALHRLHLEQRRTRLPIQLAMLAFVIAAGMVIAAGLVLSRLVRLSPRAARSIRFLCLCAAALLPVTLAGGALPHRTYGSVFPFMALGLPLLAAVSLAAAPSRDPLGPFTVLGVLALAIVWVDALFGWHAARVPLFGGTMFDGARFYGLPNYVLPMEVASMLFLARRLPDREGFGALVTAGLFIGFPSLGADVGGAIALFAAAGLWWVIRTRDRIRMRDVAFVAAVVAVGLAAVLLANRYLPGAPTHATRFVQRAGGRLGTAFGVVGHRLGTLVHQVASQPGNLVPLTGIVVVLILVLRRPSPVGQAMDLDRRWRDVVLTLIVASGVAFIANDTGASAAAPGFIYALVGISYPAMLLAERNRA
jgi:hypothetical protein